MTPKELAEQLIHNFTAHTVSNLGGDQTYANAKECANIAVDEILKAVDNFGYTGTMFNDFETGQILMSDEKDPCAYWQLVKTELEKL